MSYTNVCLLDDYFVENLGIIWHKLRFCDLHCISTDKRNRIWKRSAFSLCFFFELELLLLILSNLFFFQIYFFSLFDDLWLTPLTYVYIFPFGTRSQCSNPGKCQHISLYQALTKLNNITEHMSRVFDSLRVFRVKFSADMK